MTGSRSFVLARWLVAALVFCTALLTVSGIASQYFDLGPEWNPRLKMACAASFAGIAVFSLATSQVAASMAQTLSKSEHHVAAFRMAVGCTLVTGAISVGGAHMGAIVLGLDPLLVDIGGLCLAFVKPCMSFVAEACDEIEKAAKLAEDHRAQEGEWALRRETIHANAPRPAEPANDAAEIVAPVPAAARLKKPVNQRQAAHAFRREINRQEPKQRTRAGEKPLSRQINQHDLAPITVEEIRAACAAIAGRAPETCEVISISSVARQAKVGEARIRRRPDLRAVLDEPEFTAYRAA